MDLYSLVNSRTIGQPQYEVNPSDIMIKFTAPNDRVISSVTNRVTEKVTENLQGYR